MVLETNSLAEDARSSIQLLASSFRGDKKGAVTLLDAFVFCVVRSLGASGEWFTFIGPSKQISTSSHGAYPDRRIHFSPLFAVPFFCSFFVGL